MITASTVHWRTFKHNEEADNTFYETLSAYVLQWLSIIDNKEEDKNL